MQLTLDVSDQASDEFFVKYLKIALDRVRQEIRQLDALSGGSERQLLPYQLADLQDCRANEAAFVKTLEYFTPASMWDDFK